MPQLDASPSAQERIHEIFAAYWSHLAGDGVEIEILTRLGHIDNQIVLDALNAHLDDTTPSNAGGRPTGAYPPTVADLQRHIQAADQKAWLARKNAKEAKLKQEMTQESDRAAVHVINKLNWRELIGQHQAKRDAIIAHLQRAAGLDFTQGSDREAFRPVQAALYASNSELAPDEAVEIFRAARLPNAKKTPIEEEQARAFAERRREQAKHPVDAQAMRSFAPHLVKIPQQKGRAA